MARQLDHSRLSFPINTGALKRPVQNKCAIGRIETEAAAKLFRCLFNAIRLMNFRPSHEPNRLRLPHERAGQAIDEQG